MAGRSDETKQKLLRAATAEFARYGLAGARTRRIADAAGANESLLHRYFVSKNQLFRQVLDALVTDTTDAVPITADDLPGYAGRLFDHYQTHPEVVRLSVWNALERPDGESASDAESGVIDAFRHKEGQIAAAQAAGKVTTSMSAAELLSLVIQLSLSGGPTTAGTEPAVDLARRRRSVVTAVTALVELTLPPRRS